MKNLDEFYIEFLPTNELISPDNIIQIDYVTVLDGFNSINEIQQTLIIKLTYINGKGKLKCLESNSNDFKFHHNSPI